MEVSQPDLARVFGVSVRTIQRWGKKGLDAARVGSTATYDLAAAVAWRIDSVREPDESDDEYLEARARRMEADAELKEHELARRRRDLVALDDVVPLLREPLELVNRTLKAAPERLAGELASGAGCTHAEAVAILRDAVEDLRSDLRKLGARDYDASRLLE